MSLSVRRFDPTVQTVGVDSQWLAAELPAQPDPPVPFDGMTFGVATMTTNSPHGGERHPDGDEILYLVSGHVRIVFIDDPFDDIDVWPGQGLIVPKGVWHRVDIIEPSQIVYLTPGPNNEFREQDA